MCGDFDDNAPNEIEARLYAAQLLAKQGHLNEALARMRNLEQTDYAPIAARATYVRVDTQLQAKRIKPKEAIETLEKLRYRWRGDDLELKTLRKLGNLYFAENDWRNGLNMLRMASLNFPGAELGREQVRVDLSRQPPQRLLPRRLAERCQRQRPRDAQCERQHVAIVVRGDPARQPRLGPRRYHEHGLFPVQRLLRDIFAGQVERARDHAIEFVLAQREIGRAHV